MTNMNGRELAEATANALNTTLDYEVTVFFVNAMSVQHRTLQQNFTRLCAAWLEHLAALPENCHDARNAASVEYAKRVVAATGKVGLPNI